jgi:molybdopterin synthase catalytic subunit
MKHLIDKIKNHPEYPKVGMILCHNGVVRETSRNGRKVKGLRVKVDHRKLKDIVEKHKRRSGIVDILVEINEEKDLVLGEDVMYLVVAGNIRENVIAALTDTLNDIKSAATRKSEYFVENKENK